MRKVICLLMVLVLCMSLGCVAFATDSVGNMSPEGTEAPDAPGGSGGSDVPQTGDNSAIFMWVLVMLASMVALVAVGVYYRKVAAR